MNCKPGDLAVIVKSLAGNEGRLVNVVNSDVYMLPGDLSGMPHPLWRVRSLGEPVRSTIGWIDKEFAFPDAWLKPIRDPGEDATDETLTWLPVPSRERETA